MKNSNEDNILRWFAVLIYCNFIQVQCRTFKLFFVSVMFFSLLIPAYSPQFSFISNLNTDFDDLPEPLRQFYLERLYAQWNYMQPAYAEPQQTTKRIASPINPNISDREITNYGNGTFTQAIGVPMYVLDTDNTFKDSFVESNSTHIKLVNAENPITFQKSDCTFVKYTDVSFNTKFADYYTTMAIKVGSNPWAVYDALQLDCTYNTFKNATGQYLTVQRVHNKGVFDVTYTKLVDGAFKSYMRFENNPSPNGLQDTRVSFVEVIGNITTSSFNINGTNQWNNLDIGTQKIFTQKDLTSENKRAFHIAKGSSFFNIDLGTDFSDLLAIRATKTSDSTFNLEIVFGSTAQPLDYGQIVTNDPTFTSSNPTIDGNMADDGNNDICDGDALTELSGFATNDYGLQDTGSTEDCYYAFFEYDVSSVDDTATITNIVFKFEISVATDPRTCVFVGMEVQPSVVTDNEVWNSIATNSTLVTDSSCQSVGTNKSVDLGSAGDTYVQDQLSLDFIAIGVKSSDETMDTLDHQGKFVAEEGTGTPDPTLEVTYTTTLDFQVDVNEADETTAVTNGNVIVTNSTGIFTFALNSTGIARITETTGVNHNMTVKDGNNFVTNKTLNFSPSIDEEVVTIDSLIHDISGCDATISNLKLNDTDGHYVASVPTSPSCSNDVLTFDYFYKALGSGSAGSNYTTTLRFEVGTNSVYARTHQILVNGSDVGSTYSNGVVTSGTIQVDDGASDVILKVTINLRGDHYVQAFENDGTTTITSADILNTNSSTTGTNSVNSTGWAFITGVIGSQNMTLKETTDNFVTNKTYNTQLTGNTYLNGLIFDESCPQNGAGNDFEFKLNHTNYHRISTHTTPVCATTGSDFNVTASITFTADGNAPSHNNLTSSLILTIQNTTAFGKDAQVLRINGTQIDTSYSGGKITSSAFDVASGYSTVLLNVDISLDPKPTQVAGLSVSCTTATSCVASWNEPSSGVTAIQNYTLEYKLSSSETWSMWDNDLTVTSDTVTGLGSGGTYNFRVTATNTFGDSPVSDTFSAATQGAGGSSVGGGGGGSGSSASIIPSLSDALVLSLGENSHKMMLGETLTEREMQISWNSKQDLYIESIRWADSPLQIQFMQISDITLKGTSTNCKFTDNIEKCTSTGIVRYSVYAPLPDDDPCDPACIEETRYEIPVEVTGRIGNDQATVQQNITISIGDSFNVPLLILLAVGSIPIIGIVMQKAKNGKKHRNPLASKPTHSRAKNGSMMNRATKKHK